MTEFVIAEQSKGEVLLFRRSHLLQAKSSDDEESNHRDLPITHNITVEKGISPPIEAHAATFLWDNLSYTIKTKDGPLKILDDIEGWIKPGSLTALMVCFSDI